MPMGCGNFRAWRLVMTHRRRLGVLEFLCNKDLLYNKNPRKTVIYYLNGNRRLQSCSKTKKIPIKPIDN